MKSRWNGFQSPLAEGIQHFLAYKRALGQSFSTEECALRLLDTFLVEQNVKSIDEVSREVVNSFLASRPRRRPRSYNHLISVLGRLLMRLQILLLVRQLALPHTGQLAS